MVTIKDVARLAGVSIATVSRTLAEPEKVSERTRGKVLAAVKSSGYVTNSLARNFRRRRSNTVLVLVPNIANPYFSSIIKGVEKIASEHRYQILLGDTQQKPEIIKAYFNLVAQKQADAIISLDRDLPLEGLSTVPFPLVMASEYPSDTSVPSVCIDNVAAGKEAVGHLLQLGHTRIGFMKGPGHSRLSKDRFSGYKKALKSAKVSLVDDWIIGGDFSLQSGFDAMNALLKLRNMPSAIFCANDEMAIGAMRACQDACIDVPKTMSIVGFDDIDAAAFTFPRLTTVRQPRTEIGTQAMSLILALLEQELGGEQKIELAHELVIRESTCNPY